MIESDDQQRYGRSADEPFRFSPPAWNDPTCVTAIADPQGGDVSEILQTLIDATAVGETVLTLGDNVSYHGPLDDETVRGVFLEQLYEPFLPLIAERVLLPVVGNHDLTNRGTPPEWRAETQVQYRKWVTAPQNGPPRWPETVYSSEPVPMTRPRPAHPRLRPRRELRDFGRD